MTNPELNKLEIIAVRERLNAIFGKIKDVKEYDNLLEQEVVRLHNHYHELTGENFVYKKPREENPEIISIRNQLNQLTALPYEKKNMINDMVNDRVAMLRKQYQKLTGEEFK